MIILDDFNLKNIVDIASYNAGSEFVRNFIIYENNIDKNGGFTWHVDPYGTYFTVYIYVGDDSWIFSNYTTLKALIQAVHNTAALRDLGFDAEVVFDVTLEGTDYDEAARFTCDTTTDYRTVSIEINEGYGFSFVGEDTSYEQTSGTILRTFFTLLPTDNSTIKVKDDASILRYGKKIYTVLDYEMLTVASEKRAALEAKLAELKDPRARMTVDIPFDHSQPKELEEVQVRLSYRNIDQFRSFKEGGHFKTWTDSGEYRYKDFYIVGIQNKRDGRSTRLKFLEKEA